MPTPRFRRAAAAAALFTGLVLSGCAGHQPPQPDHDPWEGFNRKIFWFNEKADQYVMEPVARGWDFVVPARMQQAFGDFFANLRFPIVFVNTLLQGKPHDAAVSIARFEINTFFGGLGFYDLAASHFDLPRQDEDTGQTLGVWGIAPGPYLVLPLWGPSNPRDAVGLVGDAALGFYTYFVTVPGVTIGAAAVDLINLRALYLDEVERAREASLDYYTFVRNAYVQRRWRLIHDRAPDAPPGEDDLYNEDLYDVDPYEDALEGDAP